MSGKINSKIISTKLVIHSLNWYIVIIGFKDWVRGWGHPREMDVRRVCVLVLVSYLE